MVLKLRRALVSQVKLGYVKQRNDTKERLTCVKLHCHLGNNVR